MCRCRRCGLDVPDGLDFCGTCLRNPPPYDHVLAAVDYAPPWDRLVAAFKFRMALDLAPALVQRLLEARNRVRDQARHAKGAEPPPAPDLLLPVPLSAQRLRERGYNQAWEIARRLGRALEYRADARLLLRVKDTPHQLALAVGQRAANVDGAFAVEPLRRAELLGRTVAVVDDVLTTGATAAEISRTLLQAGAASVQVWVVARTPRPQDR